MNTEPITLENYVRTDLRNRFDDANIPDCLGIIDETRLLGLTDLADEFLKELKDDPDGKRFLNSGIEPDQPNDMWAWDEWDFSDDFETRNIIESPTNAYKLI